MCHPGIEVRQFPRAVKSLCWANCLLIMEQLQCSHSEVSAGEIRCGPSYTAIDLFLIFAVAETGRFLGETYLAS